jgi:hypothetical protein
VKKSIRAIGLALARRLGTSFADVESGQPLGRAFAFAWRGKIHLIGLETTVRARFLPQSRVTYWKQEIGFSRHPLPDFPNVRDASLQPEGEMPADSRISNTNQQSV